MTSGRHGSRSVVACSLCAAIVLGCGSSGGDSGPSPEGGTYLDSSSGSPDGSLDSGPGGPADSSAAGSDVAPAQDAQGGTDSAPDSSFDTSGLTIEGGTGMGLCQLSTDGSGRSLLVTVKNMGATDVGPTTVRVATSGGMYTLDVSTPSLASGASAQLQFDRGPLVGFVADWQFNVTIDPDAQHGPAHAPVAGECTDLRSRAVAGMVPLGSWYDATTGLWNTQDWWTSANQLETLIDYSRETGDTTYIADIDNTFVKNSSNNFDKYGYYDDDGWWALAWIKAYDLSHQQKYLDMAKTIFTRMTGGWDSTCGGGLYWASAEAGSNGRANKNAIPNELFLTVAARLHLRTPGDSGPGSYLDWAQREWTWFSGTGMITADNQIVDGLTGLTTCPAAGPVFTYNQGVVLGGLADFAASTGDMTLLDKASAIAHATMTKMSNANGVLVETPCGGDVCVQFKGIFMRNLAYLYKARPLPELQTYMRHQSDNLWNTSVRDAQNQFGYAWEAAFDKATAPRQSSALDALIAAVRAANMNLAIGATATGDGAPCGGTEIPGLAVDGSSNWDSKWCEGGAGGQSLTIDLGSPRYLVGFRVRHAGAGGENSAWNTRDFEIATSSDGATWTTAVTVTGNTADVTTHPIPAVTARYARLHVSTAVTAMDVPAARIYEFETYGITW